VGGGGGGDSSEAEAEDWGGGAETAPFVPQPAQAIRHSAARAARKGRFIGPPCSGLAGWF